MERSGERQQGGGEVRESIVLTHHNRGFGRIKMGLARCSTTGVMGGDGKEGASNKNGIAQVD